MILLEEYLLTNIVRGIFLLWSIFYKIATNANCLSLLVQCGLMKLVSPSLEQANSLLLTKKILLTLKLVCHERTHFTVESEPKIVESLLKLIEVSNQENLVLIIDVVGSLKIDSTEGSQYERAIEMINKVLTTGIDSVNNIKFVIVKVFNNLFNEETKSIATEENAQKIMKLISASIKHGTTEIKVIACELMLKMIKTQLIELIKEPDIIILLLDNMMSEVENEEQLKSISVDILYEMTVSVKYLCLIVLCSSQILESSRMVLSRFHPEIKKIINGFQKKLLDPQKFEKLDIGDFVSVKEEDLISGNGNNNGTFDMNSSLNDSVNSKNSAKFLKLLKKRKKKMRKGSLNSVDTGKIFQDRSDVFSDFSDDPDHVFPNDLIEIQEEIGQQNILSQNKPSNILIYKITHKLIKMVSIMLSCDVVYGKIFAYNYQGLFSSITKRMIEEKVIQCLKKAT